MDITEQLDLAWAAGFLDGEGSFRIGPKSGGATDLTRTPTIVGTQISPVPLLKLEGLFGGSVKPRKTRTSTGKIAHDWSVKGAQAMKAVIPRLLPYLTVKRAEAEILLAYANVMRPAGSGSYPLTEFERSERRDLMDRMLEVRAEASAAATGTRFSRHEPKTKLTDEQAVHIFRSPDAGVVLAAQFDVSPSLISAIRGGRAWTRVTSALDTP